MALGHMERLVCYESLTVCIKHVDNTLIALTTSLEVYMNIVAYSVSEHTWIICYTMTLMCLCKQLRASQLHAFNPHACISTDYNYYGIHIGCPTTLDEFFNY